MDLIFRANKKKIIDMDYSKDNLQKLEHKDESEYPFINCLNNIFVIIYKIVEYINLYVFAGNSLIYKLIV